HHQTETDKVIVVTANQIDATTNDHSASKVGTHLLEKYHRDATQQVKGGHHVSYSGRVDQRKVHEVELTDPRHRLMASVPFEVIVLGEAHIGHFQADNDRNPGGQLDTGRFCNPIHFD